MRRDRRQTRRELLRDAVVLLAGASLPARGFPAPQRAAAARGAPATLAQNIPPLSPALPVGWVRFAQSQLGVAFDYPQGWTVRVLESGLAGVSQSRDGLSGPRAYGQLFTVKEGTSSATLIHILANGLKMTLDGFRVVEVVRLSQAPDLSALRYTFPYVDGLRKGSLTVSVNKGGAALLGFDAPGAAYAAHVETLATTIGSFRWFASSLRLQEAVEPRERAYSVMLPGGWAPHLRVIRPHIDAGFVAKASDPTGAITVEVHRPRVPSFITPDPMLTQAGLPEGAWYRLGEKWGMEPLLVYRYLPGSQYIRSFLLPTLQRARPGARIVGIADRPDLALDPEVALLRKALAGSGAGGEAEYTWTRADGARMRGRAVALTTYSPNPAGHGPGLWAAPQVLLAEGPARDFNTAVIVLVTMNASLKINSRWLAAERQGARERWRIINETERVLFTKYQEAVKHRQDAVLAAAEKWDAYIRHSFAGSSDYGGYVPYSRDTILTGDGQVVPVIQLGGQTVAEWMKENPNGYLKKAW